jgi:Homeodomain-like domain
MEDREGILMIRPDELKRYQLIGKIFDKNINQQEAAELLGISDRQVRRIVRRVRVEGERGVIHRLRGRQGCRRIPDNVRARVLELYQERYNDFGPTLASEKLLELDHLRVSDETLRLWLAKDGLWQVDKHRNKKKRSWRARKDKFGQMVQMDGSHHDWLEGRGPKLVLMGYIDDATGKIYGKFFDYEGTLPAMGGLKEYIRRNGIPGQVYLDKHSTYRNNRKYKYTNWPFRDEEELTQFERACRQLGIEVIHAHSPQAKGRVERLFKTLQDRLVKEMRLIGVKTCIEANVFIEKYIDKFNARFAVEARKKGNAHRLLDKRIRIDDILSVQTEHVLRNDRTVMHERKLYQVINKTRAQRVVVFEYLDKRMAIKYGGESLNFSVIEERPQPKPKIQEVKKFKSRLRYIPSRNSFWRVGFKLKGSPCFQN